MNLNRTGNARIMQQRDTFVQPLLSCTSSIKYFEGVFVSLRDPASDVLSSIACPVLQHFPPCQINDITLGGGVMEHKMCFDFIYNCRLKIFILKRNE